MSVRLAFSQCLAGARSTRAQRSVGHVMILWIGAMGGSGSVFLVNVLIARVLGASDFGTYSSVYAIATGLSLVGSFGIAQFWLKAFGEEGWGGRRWLVPSLKAQGIVAALAAAGMIAWAELGPHEQTTRMMLRVMTLYLFGQISLEMVSAKLQLTDRYPLLAIWQVAPNFTRLVIFILLLGASASAFSLQTVVVVYGIVSLAMVAAGGVEIYRMLGGSLDLVGHGAKVAVPASTDVAMTRVLRASWPYGLASVVAFVYLQLDIVMVKYLAGDEAAGYYAVALSITTAAIVLPGILYQKYLLVKYHRWASHDLVRLQRFSRAGSIISFGSGFVLMILIISTSWVFVPLVFGTDYEPTIMLVNLLAITLPLYFLSYNSGSVLVAIGGIQLKLWVMVGVALINILCNLILIPHIGLNGAVASKALAYFILCFSYLFFVKRRLSRLNGRA